MDKKITGKAILLAVVCTFLWGCAFPSIKLGYRWFQIESGAVFSQTLFAGIRFFLAGVVILLACLLFRRGGQSLSIKSADLPYVFLLGILQTGLQYFFFYLGLAHTTGVKGSILNSTSVFMTVLMVGIIWRKRDPLTLRKIGGCILGFLGVVLINLGDGLTGALNFGDAMVLLSSLCMAFSNPLTKVLAQRIDSILLSGLQLTIGGAGLILTGFLGGGHMGNWSMRGILLMAFMVFISAVAFPIWTGLLKEYNVSRISCFNFLIPVFGVCLSGVLLGEGLPGLAALVALFLVCGGILLVNGE